MSGVGLVQHKGRGVKGDGGTEVGDNLCEEEVDRASIGEHIQVLKGR